MPIERMKNCTGVRLGFCSWLKPGDILMVKEAPSVCDLLLGLGQTVAVG